MRIFRTAILTWVGLLVMGGQAANAQTKAPVSTLDWEMLTWPELKKAMSEGKTTALFYVGGTETRGPQNVNGGHTLMGHATALAIAQKLGNAIVAPMLAFSTNNASAALPGAIGLTAPVFAAVVEQIADQIVKNGFKNVVLMGDHGGGQKELSEVAKKLDEKYASQGIRVVYCDDVYSKANADFDKYLVAHNLPVSTHAGIPDTSEMLYLGGDEGWVRKELIPSALGDMPPKPGEARDPNAPRVNNGIRGDARASTVELGKLAFNMKVNEAVDQIHRLLGAKAAQ